MRVENFSTSHDLAEHHARSVCGFEFFPIAVSDDDREMQFQVELLPRWLLINAPLYEGKREKNFRGEREFLHKICPRARSTSSAMKLSRVRLFGFAS